MFYWVRFDRWRLRKRLVVKHYWLIYLLAHSPITYVCERTIEICGIHLTYIRISCVIYSQAAPFPWPIACCSIGQCVQVSYFVFSYFILCGVWFKVITQLAQTIFNIVTLFILLELGPSSLVAAFRDLLRPTTLQQSFEKSCRQDLNLFCLTWLRCLNRPTLP